MELKVGDVVKLKSGGPEMTVCTYPFVFIDGEMDLSQADCEWFAEGERKH